MSHGSWILVLWHTVPMRLSAMLFGMGLDLPFVILSQIMLSHPGPVLKAECYLFTILLLRETAHLTFFFSPFFFFFNACNL